MKLSSYWNRETIVQAGLVCLVTLIASAIVVVYISSERFFYYWDLGGYQGVAIYIAQSLSRSFLSTLATIKGSVQLEYNYFYTILPTPWILLFGDSRLSYVLSISLVYHVPYILVVGAIAREMVPEKPRAVFWSTVLLGLLTPIAWAPTLRSYPDVGAALLISLAIWLYLKDPALHTWWRVVLIGILAALGILFRRHFAYGAVALYFTIGLQTVLTFLAESQKNHRLQWHDFFTTGIRIAISAFVTVLVLLLSGTSFLIRAITTNYAALYTSYAMLPGQILKFFLEVFGLGTWILVGLGFLLGLFRRVLRPSVVQFFLLLGGVTLAQWAIIVKYQGIPYALHLTLFVLLGLTAFIWTAWASFRKAGRVFALAVSFAFIIANFIVGLSPLIVEVNLLPWFSMRYPPLTRPDYDEVVRLIEYLRSNAPGKEIYVVDSSSLMNYDILIKGEQALFEDQRLSLFASPHIDSRDFYPLEQLLQADYVIVTTPFQSHLANPEEQKVVKVVFDAFTENWEIAQDFTRLPSQFNLAYGAVLNIYQRVRPTSLATALRTFNEMRNYIGRTPGGQADWIVLNKPAQFMLQAKPGQPLQIQFSLDAPSAEPPVFLLYAKEIPARLAISGDWSTSNENCPEALLGYKLVDNDFQVTGIAEQPVVSSLKPATFTFELRAQPNNNLLLYIQPLDKHPTQNGCFYTMNWILAK
jgi:hypothetical protein